MPTMFATHRATRIDSRSPPPLGGIVSRAEPPPRASGFGVLMEQEHDLKSATESYLRTVNGRRAPAIADMLWEHRMRLETNLTLLEQRYQTLPAPERFRAVPNLAGSAGEGTSGAATESLSLLPRLLALHQNLLDDIGALVTRRGDGQRGDLILAQVGQNHERMAAAIAAFLSSQPIGDPSLPPIVGAGPPVPRAEERWENEGGATSGSSAAGAWPPAR